MSDNIWEPTNSKLPLWEFAVCRFWAEYFRLSSVLKAVGLCYEDGWIGWMFVGVLLKVAKLFVVWLGTLDVASATLKVDRHYVEVGLYSVKTS
ncbi:hypothetical protein [Paenibacillus etheri]|uniref:Uncharacterized protein n=1 Tax=Paenibacillus etheri TaxID=1306852 RepID=A0A0W1AQV1_9BACL|nr:hypothetical protein [Paenibacillus etheri]KTD83713.1 hypothetical protein UQ64_01245 [Paenibacillus etheri]